MTRREQEVYDLLVQGYSNIEIGEKLFISKKTVQFHVSHIMTYTGHRSRMRMIAGHYMQLLRALTPLAPPEIFAPVAPIPVSHLLPIGAQNGVYDEHRGVCAQL